MKIKLYYQGAIHLLPKGIAYPAVRDAVRQLYPEIPQKFKLCYIDSEKDEIVIGSQSDLQLAQDEAPTLRLFVQGDLRHEGVNQPVHSFSLQAPLLDKQVVAEPIKKSEEQVKKQELPIEQPVLKEEDKKQASPHKERSIKKDHSLKREKRSPRKQRLHKEDRSQKRRDHSESPKWFKNKQGCFFKQRQQMIMQVTQEAITNMIPTIAREVAKILHVELPPQPAQEQKVQIHFRIICDGCGQENIPGVRYKCAECPDFDFCESCEATKPHPHCFIKIKKPSNNVPPMRKMMRQAKKEIRKFAKDLKKQTGEDATELMMKRLESTGFDPTFLTQHAVFKGLSIRDWLHRLLNEE